MEEGLSGRTTTFRDPLYEGLTGLDYIYPCLMSHDPVGLLIDKAIAVTDCWCYGKPNILVVTPQNSGRKYAHTEDTGCHYLDTNKVVEAEPNQIDFMHLTEEGQLHIWEYSEPFGYQSPYEKQIWWEVALGYMKIFEREEMLIEQGREEERENTERERKRANAAEAEIERLRDEIKNLKC